MPDEGHCEFALQLTDLQASTMSDIDGRYRLLGPGGQTVVLCIDQSGPEVELPVGAPLQYDLPMPAR
ncbi:MAG: hypothetical protein H6835_16480 [Planctomycetes bacterium]|nr:hypothetical protein [Planctomycetota bacterium]